MKFASGLGGLGLSFEWKIKKVDEIKADISNAIAMGPFGSNIKTENFVARGVPVIRGINLSKGKLYEEEYVYITEEKADELKSSNAFPGDLVFTHRGTLGQVGIIPFNSKYRRYVVSQSQMKLTCNTKQVNPLFVYYFFKSNIGQHALLMNTSTTGVPAISRPVTSLKNIEIPLPALDEQQRIVDILNALDDKIELNNAINKNLEEMAQALFKRWFVDFEFPNENGEPYKSSGGEFEESELGLIPKGWKTGCFGDISICYDSKRIPLSKKEREVRKKVYPYYGAASLMDYVDQYLFNGVHVLMGEDGTVINDEGYPVLQYVWGKFWVNNHAHVLKGKSDFSEEYIYLLLKRTNVRHIVTGAVQPKINQANMKGIKVIIPEISVLNQFNQIIDGLFELIRKNSDENCSLSNARDTLLPKLMSGEIRVPVDRDHNVSELLMVAESAATYQS